MLQDSFKKKIFIFIFISIFIFFFSQLNFFSRDKNFSIKGFEEKSFLYTEKDFYVFEGVAHNNKKIFINEVEVFLDGYERFSKKVFLSENSNTFYLKFIEKNNKIYEKKITIFKK